MNPLVLVYLFFLHFVADFLLQSRDMGKRKSEVFSVLLQHLAIQFSIVFFGLLLVMSPGKALLLSALNAVVHGVIDWNIWRGYKLLAGLRIKRAVDEEVRTSPAKFHDDWAKHPEYKVNFIRNKTDERIRTWQFWNDHWFYATIGLDQLLHVATLTLVYGWLS